MPDINLTPLPLDGDITSADQIMEFCYDPVADSFGVINGKLGNENRKSTWNIDRKMIRPGSMTGGRMVGLTGNLDYLEVVSPAVNTEPGAYVPVPGAAIAFRLPYDATVVLFTWQVVGANDSIFGSLKVFEVTELRFYIDGGRQDAQFRAIPDSVRDNPDPEPNYRYKHRERLWAGHCLRANASGTTVLAAGWHTAHIGIFNLAPCARMRIRNLKYGWWR